MVQHLLAGTWKKLARSEYVHVRHDNVINWEVKNGLLPEGTKWYAEKWEKGKVIANDGKKLFWDWEHKDANKLHSKEARYREEGDYACRYVVSD